MAYRCATCGKVHEDLPHIGSDRPDHWFDVAETEREKRCKLTSDTCEIDGQFFFVRGVINIPIHDYPRDFGFGAWVSLKKENFQTYLDNFDSDQIGPFFGWLCTNITYYPSNDQIKTMVHFQGNGQRPYIVIETTDYALSRAQRDGISLDEAWKIVHSYIPKQEQKRPGFLSRLFGKGERS